MDPTDDLFSDRHARVCGAATAERGTPVSKAPFGLPTPDPTRRLAATGRSFLSWLTGRPRAISSGVIVDALAPPRHAFFNRSTRPYVRWWWLCGPFHQHDIAAQLDWLKANGFGGVEIAWLAPHWLGRHEPPPAWLSARWSELVATAATLAEARGLGCDFTFGSAWPFGGSWVNKASASQTFSGLGGQRLQGSWEDYAVDECRIVNHLSREALNAYAAPLLTALSSALRPGVTALFCDSLELDTTDLWDAALWRRFEQQFGYSLRPFIDSLDTEPGIRYDYRKLIAATLSEEFYGAFTDIARRAGVYSRVQCHGSPTDLLAAYGAVDIPESETLLFAPAFSRIAGSAAALNEKPVVSCETFTCLYGFSHYRDISLYPLWKNEAIDDLRLLADAVIANGVNQIVWHGMPFNAKEGNTEFYAAVHVGPHTAWAESLGAFNYYLSVLCRIMQSGATYPRMAVYLPNEDNWIAGAIPAAELTPGASQRWEMRHVQVPAETEGYSPLWVSLPALLRARVKNGVMSIAGLRFALLYIDCTWLDAEALAAIYRLAHAGVPVVVKRAPRQPGKRPQPDYTKTLSALHALPNVGTTLDHAGVRPFVSGGELPYYWSRRVDDDIYVFLAHPAAKNIRYPMRYRQSEQALATSLKLRFRWYGHDRKVSAQFAAKSSALLRLRSSGAIERVRLPTTISAGQLGGRKSY